MEWGLGRFDAFVPAVSNEVATRRFPQTPTPESRHTIPLGIDNSCYAVNGAAYPLAQKHPLSASAQYVVLSREHAKQAEQFAEPPFQVIVITDFIVGLKTPMTGLSAQEQVVWLTETLTYLQEELRCSPTQFSSAQAAWRHHEKRRMARQWKQVNIAQNEFWFSLPQAPLTEAFTLVENRANRCIVTGDLRSAYGWAIATQSYPHPDTWTAAQEIPADGRPYLALCRLSKPTAWLSRHHPWSYTEQGNTLPFFWDRNDTVAGWFPSFELEAVRGLCEIEVLDLRIPSAWGPHPMANAVQTWFDKRFETDRYEVCWKLKIAAAHSWTTRYCTDTVPAEMIDAYTAERFHARRFTQGRRYFFERYDRELGRITYMHDGPDAGVWLPQAWTAILVRTRLFSLMRWVAEKFEDAECAYANVDAAHWSIPASQRDAFITTLKESSWHGELMGDLKIENVSEKGLWLRPGAYILWNSGHIVASTLGENPWTFHRQPHFWQRNWQALFGLAGSVRHTRYQRPTHMDAWTAPQRHLTRMLLKTVRWKEAAWLHAGEPFINKHKNGNR